MKRLIIALTIAGALTVPSARVALADDFHTILGQPAGQPDFNHGGISCSTFTVTPGNTGTASLAPNSHGSPFNPNATPPYAGNPGNPATNQHAVSQYDVACFQQTQHAL